MANYIVGTTAMEFIIEGFLIPKAQYDQFELDCGKRSYLEVNDTELKKLKENNIFKDMLAKGEINVTTTKPAGKVSKQEKISDLEKEIVELKKQLAEKEAKKPVKKDTPKVEDF